VDLCKGSRAVAGVVSFLEAAEARIGIEDFPTMNWLFGDQRT